MPRLPIGWAAIAGAVLVAAPTIAAPDTALATQLHQRTQALVDAIATGDKAVWDAALDPGALLVTPDNVVKTKVQLLAEVAPMPAELSGQVRVGDFKLNRDGAVAIASYTNYENLDYYGQLVRSRYKVTDIWVQKDNAWLLVASHAGAMLDDPTAVTLAPDKLADYVGQYELTMQMHYRVGVIAGKLVGQRQGGKPGELKPEAADVFFTPGAPRVRKIFRRDASGRVVDFVDRREGHDVVWKKLQ